MYLLWVQGSGSYPFSKISTGLIMDQSPGPTGGFGED